MAKYFGNIRRTKSAELPKSPHPEPYRRISAKDILLGRIHETPEPPPPALPDRPWRRHPTHAGKSPGRSMPPDLPASRPPDIPRRVPDPVEEPPLPVRPAKPGQDKSPSRHSWYHANLDRKRAEAMLRKYSKDGTYIVRDSTKVSGEYSLSLWFGGGIRHLRIRLRPDRKFVLGEEKSDENAFSTVVELVQHHKQQPLHLKSGGETTLIYECPH